MDSKCINLSPAEAAAAAQEQLLRIVRPLAKQPDECFWPAVCDKPGAFRFIAVNEKNSGARDSLIVKCPLGAVGGELVGREAYWQRYGQCGMTEWGEVIPGIRLPEIIFVAGNDEPEIPSSGYWVKRSATTMHAEDARHRWHVGSDLRVCRVGELTEADCLQAGILTWTEGPLAPLYFETQEQMDRNDPCELGYDDPRKAFAALWDRRYAKRPELQWDRSPWVCTASLEAKEQAK